MKRVLILADLHCGHRSGLTPPGWQYPEDSTDPDRLKYGRIQRIIWNWYREQIEAIKPVDRLIMNGDAVDGKGERSGGTEQTELDRSKQADMAVECLRLVGAPVTVMTFGTPYHTGVDEDWEREVAQRIGAEKIADHLELDINGVTFHVRHFIPRSIIPHGKFTPLARDGLWEKLWALEEERTPAQIILRAHAHYFLWGGDDSQAYFISPALNGYSKYGVRRCSGNIHIGFIWIDIEENGSWKWNRALLKLSALRSPRLQL